METKFLDYDFTKQVITQSDLRLGSEPSGVNEVSGNMGNARGHALNAVADQAKPDVVAVDNTKDITLDSLKYY
jgi:hypothetical protein